MSAATYWGERVKAHLEDMIQCDDQCEFRLGDEAADRAATCAVFAGSAARIALASQPQGYLCQWCGDETLSVNHAGLCGRCEAETTTCDRCQVRQAVVDFSLVYDRPSGSYVPICVECQTPDEASHVG